ncbi:hypothetical protein BpHYR1_002531 [Brachionus plicatilis]|uniref:Uncharacterized protein n=1 Tax=Brachionus plicatilis TaxID=10195 RepID=A0A3M7SQK1_BRAPC|nr:hypothetical protein BpHYR1_002531 [Brachionus plicatilis]
MYLTFRTVELNKIPKKLISEESIKEYIKKYVKHLNFEYVIMIMNFKFKKMKFKEKMFVSSSCQKSGRSYYKAHLRIYTLKIKRFLQCYRTWFVGVNEASGIVQLNHFIRFPTYFLQKLMKKKDMLIEKNL